MEFALVFPVLTLMLMGIMEWGWFFHNELSIVNTARFAVRVGATTRPAYEESAGSCTLCISRARTSAFQLLSDSGVTAPDSAVTTTISSVGGTCALTVGIELPYSKLAGMVPIPTQNHVTVTQPMEFVNGCD